MRAVFSGMADPVMRRVLFDQDVDPFQIIGSGLPISCSPAKTN